MLSHSPLVLSTEGHRARAGAIGPGVAEVQPVALRHMTITDQTAPLKERVTASLAGLGGSADEIAQHLKDLGIKGARWRASSCALSCFVKHAYDGELRDVGTTPDYLSIYSSVGFSDFESINFDRLEVGAALKKFVLNFDAGSYPELLSAWS